MFGLNKNIQLLLKTWRKNYKPGLEIDKNY